MNARLVPAPSRSLAVALALVTVLVSASMVDAAAARQRRAPEPQLSSGSCVEAFFVILVDAERVRPHVPERFEPVVTGGKTRVAVFSEDCSMSLDEAAPISVSPSGVNIPIAPPPGESGNHSYNVLWATDSRTHYRWMRRLGSGTLIEESVFEYAPGPVATAFSDVPGWFTFTMVGGDPPAVDAGPALTTVHWQLGRFGAVRNVYPHTNFWVVPGHAVVRAEPGSRLADMIGEGPIHAEGLLGRFDFTGVSEVVE